jgi:hypothetical protein
VFSREEQENRFNGFSTPFKPLKRFESDPPVHTPLKRGVNEIREPTASGCAVAVQT